jgi:hypothetical protein
MTESHETLDVRPKAAMALALGLMVLVGFAFVATFIIFGYFVPRQAARPNLATAVQDFPEPRLQIAPGEDLETLNNANRQKLDSYGWIDRSTGVARIPIERAIDIVVQQGWQERADDKQKR